MNFASVSIQNKKNCLRMNLRTNNDKLNDPKNLTQKIPKTHGYGNITRSLFVSPKDIKEKKYSVDDIVDNIFQSNNATQ